MTSTPDDTGEAVQATPTADELSLGAAALSEIAAPGAVGEVLGASLEGDHVLVLRYGSKLDGYPDWAWTVLLSRAVEGAPSVLEATLMPSEGSLLAPAWVPWADRLADYLAAREAEAKTSAEVTPLDSAADDESDDETAGDAASDDAEDRFKDIDEDVLDDDVDVVDEQDIDDSPDAR